MKRYCERIKVFDELKYLTTYREFNQLAIQSQFRSFNISHRQLINFSF